MTFPPSRNPIFMLIWGALALLVAVGLVFFVQLNRVMSTAEQIRQQTEITIDQERALIENPVLYTEARRQLPISLKENDEALGWTLASFSAGVIILAALIWLVYYLIQREAQQRAEVEESLRLSEERYALAARGTNDGLWDWNLISNEIYFSPRWKAILGFADHELTNTLDNWFNRVYEKDINALRADLDAHLSGKIPHFNSEYRMRRKDGSLVWVLSRGVFTQDQAGQYYHLAGSLTDITDRKQAEEQLVYNATHDPLTGLFNRQAVFDRLHAEFSTARRYGHTLSLCICDLDRFKSINDTHGHPAGDEVISAYGRLLKETLRDSDIAGRLGGDEFCIIFPYTSASAALPVLERLRDSLEQLTFMSESGTFQVTGSFGIAEYVDGLDERALIELADQALYRAKHSRNRVEVVLEPGPSAG